MNYMTGRYHDLQNPRVAHSVQPSTLVPWLSIYTAREVESGFRVQHCAVFTDDYGNHVPTNRQTVVSLQGANSF